MKTTFYKYQGTGNDFIVIDNRSGLFQVNPINIANLCNRHYGIGADGLMLLQNKAGYDFEMLYFNADGYEGSMCGNGGRCIVAFAKHLGIITKEVIFLAVDGPHQAVALPTGNIALKMKDVDAIVDHTDYYTIDTGSPHYVTFVQNLASLNVADVGRSIRNQPQFFTKGINVNFVAITKDEIWIRTYERGVEAETQSCGTGVTAAVLVTDFVDKMPQLNHYSVHTTGGTLKVSFKKLEKPGQYNEIWLEGPAKFVFEGKI